MPPTHCTVRSLDPSLVQRGTDLLLGMAVTSAHALGLHRQESLKAFPPPERMERLNVWRSLYVLDRFLAAALGRPMLIADEDCAACNGTGNGGLDAGLKATVSSCQVISLILRKVYAQRKISTTLAQEIKEQCKRGPEQFGATLHWTEVTSMNIDPAHGMAVLHGNLFFCHAVILLTRPFFLDQMHSRPRSRSGTKTEWFAGGCVHAAYHTIKLIQLSHRAGYLPQRDPFVM